MGTYTVHPSNGDPDYDVSRIIVRDVLVLKAPDVDTTTGKLTASTDKPRRSPSRCPTRWCPRSPSRMHAGDDALWFVLRPGNGSQDGPITLATVKSVIFEGLNARQILQAFGPEGDGH